MVYLVRVWQLDLDFNGYTCLWKERYLNPIGFGSKPTCMCMNHLCLAYYTCAQVQGQFGHESLSYIYLFRKKKFRAGQNSRIEPIKLNPNRVILLKLNTQRRIKIENR